MKNPLAPLFAKSVSIFSLESEELRAFLTGGARTASGVSVTEQAALNVAAVWTGVHIRSRLLATLPVDVIEHIDERRREPRPRHPVAQLLRRPNAWQTRPELLQQLEAHRILRGHGLAWRNLALRRLDDDRVVLDTTELIPLHPDRVEVLVDDDDWTAPPRYRLRRSGTELPAIEVLRVMGWSADGRRARSFLTDLRETIGGAIATQRHAASLWRDEGLPVGLLQHPGRLGGPGSSASKNLEESWVETYGRGKDRRRIAVLEEGMTFTPLAITPEDGQFLETQQDLRAQIAAALMVPPHLMGLADKATSWGTGIEQQIIGLLSITLRPDLTFWEERLTRDLIAQPDRFSLKFNVRGFLAGDMRTQAEWFWRLVHLGVYSPNDVRAFLDENPIPDGDTYLQPVNLAPLGWQPQGGTPPGDSQ